MSREDSAREPENPEVREGVSIANQSGPIGFSHESTGIQQHLSLVDRRARPQHLKKAREPFHRALLIANPIPHGKFTFRLFFSTTKICPDLLNLLNAGDSFAGISSLTSCYLFFPGQGLNCFVLEGSRVFSVSFPESSLYQISELLHFIDFRRKFIKM
jgi:hypothetical protein